VADLEVDDAFTACTAESITAGGTDAHADLTLYQGATFDDPVSQRHVQLRPRPARHQ
jgi:hypothetical protein